VSAAAPFKEKWESFGWWVKEIDGHNLREIIDTLDLAATCMAIAGRSV
jgi:transketolase N-terminal domain/subunit